MERDIIYFDIETSGLDIRTEKIIELYALKVKLDGTEESIHYLFNPEKEIDKEAEDVHGYNLDMDMVIPNAKLWYNAGLGEDYERGVLLPAFINLEWLICLYVE